VSKHLRGIAALLALATAVFFGPAQATASAAVPGSCLGTADGGVVTGGPVNALLPSASGSYRTSNRCRDINFRVLSESGDEFLQANIRVCFVRAGYCQSSWKYFYGDTGAWMVIASNVKDDTTFRLEIQFYESSFGSKYEVLIAS
jgi:hypothetical protein